jgi:hypothetical protein
MFDSSHPALIGANIGNEARGKRKALRSSQKRRSKSADLSAQPIPLGRLVGDGYGQTA